MGVYMYIWYAAAHNFNNYWHVAGKNFYLKDVLILNFY